MLRARGGCAEPAPVPKALIEGVTLKITAAAALAALSIAVTTPAFADIQDFVVRNNSGVSVFYVYVSPDYTTEWEEDVLGSNTIPAYSEGGISMSGFGDHCMFDVKVEDENGYAREYYGVDLCRVTYIDFP
jgi:hypothetical protein